MSRGCGFPLLLIICLGLALIGWFMNDPLRGLWIVADANGSLSKWETRTVRVDSVRRECRIDSEAARERGIVFTTEECDASSNLKIALMAKLKSNFAGQLCFDDGSSGKHCPGVSPVYTGNAIVTASGVNKSDGDFTAQFEVPSTEPGYYIVQTGDVMNIDVCRTDPKIGRKKAKWSGTKGC